MPKRLTCVRDRSCACVYTQGLGTVTIKSAQHFWLRRTHKFALVLQTGFEPPSFGSRVYTEHWALAVVAVLAQFCFTAHWRPTGVFNQTNKQTNKRKGQSMFQALLSPAGLGFSPFPVWFEFPFYLGSSELLQLICSVFTGFQCRWRAVKEKGEEEVLWVRLVSFVCLSKCLVGVCIFVSVLLTVGLLITVLNNNNHNE